MAIYIHTERKARLNNRSSNFEQMISNFNFDTTVSLFMMMNCKPASSGFYSKSMYIKNNLRTVCYKYFTSHKHGRPSTVIASRVYSEAATPTLVGEASNECNRRRTIYNIKESSRTETQMDQEILIFAIYIIVILSIQKKVANI